MPSLLLAGWFLFSALNAINPRLSLHQMALLMTGLLAARLVAQQFSGGRAVYFLKRFGGWCVLYLTLALLHFLLIGESGFSFAHFGRKLCFTLGHYNHLGTLLLFLFPLPFIAGWRAKWSWTAVAFLGLCVLLTGSRSATGAALLELFLLIILEIPGKRRIRALLLAALAGSLFFAAAVTINPELGKKMTRGFARLDTWDARGRDVIWRGALELGRDHPWLGCGPGHYPLAIAARVQGQLLDAHNLPLNLLAETGIPGLVLAVLYFVLCLRAPQQTGEGWTRQRSLLFVALTGVLLQNLATCSLLRSAALALIFFLYLGLILAGCGPQEVENQDTADAFSNNPHPVPSPAMRLLFNGLIATIVLFFLLLPWTRSYTAYLLPWLLAVSFGLAARNLLPRRISQPCWQAGVGVAALLLACVSLRVGLAESAAFQGVSADRAGKTALARQHLSQALRLDPAVGPLWLNQGILAWRDGDRAGAIDCWQRALELMPNDPPTLNNLMLCQAPAAQSPWWERLAAVERWGYAERRRQLDSPTAEWPVSRVNFWLLASPSVLESPERSGEFVRRMVASLEPGEKPYGNARCALALAAAAGVPGARMVPDETDPFSHTPLGDNEDSDGRELLRTWLAEALDQAKRRADARGNVGDIAWYRCLQLSLDGNATAQLEPFLGETPEELVRLAWLALLRDDTPLAVQRLREADRKMRNRRPPPVHFAGMVQLVRDVRLRDHAVLPAVPAWLDDNFNFQPLAPEYLPLLIARCRGMTCARDLAGRYARAWCEAVGE